MNRKGPPGTLRHVRKYATILWAAHHIVEAQQIRRFQQNWWEAQQTRWFQQNWWEAQQTRWKAQQACRRSAGLLEVPATCVPIRKPMRLLPALARELDSPARALTTLTERAGRRAVPTRPLSCGNEPRSSGG